MNIKYLYTLVFIILISCKNFHNKEFNFPLNTIENIKQKDLSFSNVTLTIEKYSTWDKEIIASFIYNNKKASIKLFFNFSEKKVEFVNIGEESNYFLHAISDLFEERLTNPEIKDTVIFSFYKKGDTPKITFSDLFNSDNLYTLSYIPNSNQHKKVDLRMTIDMDKGIVQFWEKNGGIAKSNLIKAFQKNK